RSVPGAGSIAGPHLVLFGVPPRAFRARDGARQSPVERVMPWVRVVTPLSRKWHSGGRRFDPVQLHGFTRFSDRRSPLETIRAPIVSNSRGGLPSLQHREHLPLLRTRHRLRFGVAPGRERVVAERGGHDVPGDSVLDRESGVQPGMPCAVTTGTSAALQIPRNQSRIQSRFDSTGPTPGFSGVDYPLAPRALFIQL